MEKKKHYTLIFITFLAYYFILLGERIFSLIKCFSTVGVSSMFLAGKFEAYIYGMSSICILLFVFAFLISLGKVLANGIEKSMISLSVTAGIILIPGLLDTANSFAPVQFVAYGLLLLGCLIRYIDIMKDTEKNASHIFSFLYLASFSMAVPVVHKTDAGNTNMAYYLVEGLGSLVLVVVFVIMLCFLFSEKHKVVVNPIFLLPVLAVVGLMTFLSWGTNYINWFVVVAAGIAVIMLIITRIRMVLDKKPKIV